MKALSGLYVITAAQTSLDDVAAAIRGGASIVQDEATSVVFGMPGEAVRMGVADQCLPLSRIAPTIAGAFKG